jgi:hypothetical protein
MTFLWVHDDERAVLVAAQNKSILKITFVHGKMMEIYESIMLWRLANDLLRKVGHENDFILLIRHHEVLNVVCHNHPVPGGAQGWTQT